MASESRLPILSATSVDKRFDALVVLNQVNFAVGEREAVGIVGPNGAGKTTLLNILAGAYYPRAGTVSFRGEDVTELPVEDRCRRGIARSHQIPRPFGGMTVFENLFVAAANGGSFQRSQAYDRCIDSLKLCGMLHLANRRAETLGLLDRKRLELARAVATNPVVLLLDEMLTGLTPTEARAGMQLVREVRDRGVTILMVEHVMEVLLPLIDSAVVLHLGRNLAQGSPRDVVRNTEVIRSYLGDRYVAA